MTPEEFKRMVPSDAVRFIEKLDMSGDCWVWLAAKDGCGYGKFRYQGELKSAHRLTYSWCISAVPKGKEIDHLCRVRSCVRPDHLEAVTHRENVNRGEMSSMKAVRTGYCLRGLHKLGGENAYPSNPGQCKACVQARRGPGGSSREKYLQYSRNYDRTRRNRR